MTSNVSAMPLAKRFGVCVDCAPRQEARRLGPLPQGSKSPSHCRLCGCRMEGSDDQAPALPRPFTVADRSLIRRMAPHLPASQLLELLNDRLHSDLGPDAQRYTEQMLADAIREIGETGATGGGNDWGSLRRLMGNARQTGLLARITNQMIEDFAVVFSLSPAQALRLRDTITSAQDPSGGHGA